VTAVEEAATPTRGVDEGGRTAPTPTPGVGEGGRTVPAPTPAAGEGGRAAGGEEVPTANNVSSSLD